MRSTDESDVVAITSDLIRIDTTNRGGGDAVGEGIAADYLASLLAEVGIESQRYEKAPGRTNLIARWRGSDPDLPALLLHGHLDVVPADAADWTVDPFGGVVMDGKLWGRGAVDMKNMVAMIVASVRTLIAEGFVPQRDIILAFLADEEDNSHFGARWLVAEHPEVFRGADVAISEVGGFSADIGGRPVFFVQTGEKGILWLRLRSRGRASHASQLNNDNAIIELARALIRIDEEPWPVALTSTTARLLEELRAITGAPAHADARDVLAAVGPCAPFVVPGLSNVSNATVFDAGYKTNIVPAEATASIDVRVLPGQRDKVLQRVRDLAGPAVEVTVEDDVAAVETTFDGPLVDAMRSSIEHFRPDARVVPYLLPAGTDNAMLAGLGIRGFGFAPLLLPAGYDFPAMFHGADEHVPVDALLFGRGVLTELIRRY
ncbi:M20/M25/M40 family metallo-hydrolase [Mycobacterium sp. 21AC1]|uniref:M20/M25/M40 family metallo-hydrolase n=1 Tax=[Mycobacterium] appelbergii TaxID=2939269 RepID=UPI002938FF32|nr:M20/M25/M40 family metallo-hydrolase [Mycobacterium sp. 21AC1]MDV3123998.1 M20/M25/M40 family metallo-hydrolase [Mycobacterium sp. 21AC1]